ncbi:MAG: hypothetical protein Q4C98_04065, partial [Capnocytophaga sp.]|nr:hypothetical protein [Capnocytophaga sp.]
MKKIIYTLSLIGILFSCGKEPIEIQRNNDTTWSVDKSITDDDIRERIGFDPLKENVYIKQSEIVFPSAYIGDVLVSTGAKQTVKVEVLQAAKTAIKVKLEYDTTVFDMVKEQYAGYELGEASLLPITESEKTINPGETSVEFEVNPPTMVVSKNLLVPFKATLVGNSDNVKISEKSNYAVAKLFSEKIEFNFLKEITKKIDFDFTSNKASTADSEVAIQVVSRTSTSVTLGLVRDDSAYSGTNTLAPAGIEGTIAKVTMEGTSATLKFDLTNLETIVAAGTYVLPLKPVWYDKDNTAHTFTDTILVTLRVGGIGIKNATSSATQITLPGTIINKKEVYTGFFIDDDTGGASFMSD